MLSNRELFSVISGKTSVLSPEQVGKDLVQCQERILQCLESFHVPSAQSLAKVNSSNEVKRKDFVLNISRVLNLDEWESHLLLQQYIRTEFHGTGAQLQAIFSNHLQTDAFLHKLMLFYLDERLLLLQVSKYFLALWQNDNCPFRAEFSKTVDFLASKKFPDLIFEQYLTSLEKPASYEGIQDNVQLQALCAKQLLLEQQGLLEILLLYYKDFEISATNLVKFVKVFQQSNFGKRQINGALHDASCQNVICNTGYLMSLLLLEGMDMELLASPNCNPTEHPLAREQLQLKQLHELTFKLGNSPDHGPFLLAMSIYEIKMNTTSSEKASQLSHMALHCQVFKQLLLLSSGMGTTRHGVIGSLTKSLVYSLLKLVFQNFEESSLENPIELLSLMCSLLQDSGLPTDFLTSESGIKQLLNFAKQLFPYYLTPLVELCHSLCCDNETSAVVFEVMDSLQGYTELFGKNSIDEIQICDNSVEWMRLEDRELSAGGIVLPKGTQGKLIETDGAERLIRWHLPCSGWMILLHEAEAILSEPSLHGQDGVEKTYWIFKLVKSTLSWHCGSDLDQFVLLCLQVLQRLNYYHSNDLKLVSSCVGLLTAALPLAPAVVWEQLLQCHFVPFFDSSVGVDIFSCNPNPGSFGNVVVSQELEQGCLLITKEYLTFILEFIQTIAKHEVALSNQQEGNLIANLYFIASRIFPQLVSARVSSSAEREDILEIMLQIFHVFFTMPLTVTNGTSTLFSRIQELLLHQFHHQKAGYALVSLISVDVTAIEEWNRSKLRSPENASPSYSSVLKYSLSLLYQLLLKSKKDTNGTQLEEAICHSVIQNQLPRETFQGYDPVAVMTAVARYIHYQDDAKLSTLAVLLLQQFCHLFPMALASAFGAEAEAFRNTLGNCLSSRAKPIRLKVAILEFLTLALEFQPGLTETLLSIANSSQTDKDDEIGKSSCLKPILSFIDAKGKSKFYYPDVVVAGALNFLCKLWNVQQSNVLLAVRKSDSFWKNVTLPLEKCTDDLSADQMDMLASSLLLVSHEMFRVKSDGFDPHLASCLQSFISLKLFNSISKLSYLSPSSSIDDDTKRKKLSNSKLRVSKSWFTFLVVASKLEPEKCLLVDKTNRTALVHYLLELLLNWMNTAPVDVYDSVNELVSAINVLVSVRWKSDLVGVEEIWKKSVTALLTLSEYNIRESHEVIIQVFSLCLSLAQETAARTGSLPWSTVSILEPFVCQVLQSSITSIGSDVDNESQSPMLSVAVVSINLLDEMARCCHSGSGFLDILQEYSLIQMLMKVSSYALKQQHLHQLAQVTLQFFLQLAQYPKAGSCLIFNGLSELLCLGLAPTETTNPHEHPTLEMPVFSKDVGRLWHSGVQVVTALLRNLRHEALSVAIDFLGSHKEIILQAMQLTRRLSDDEHLEQTMSVCVFLREMFHYQQEVLFVLPNVLHRFQEEVTKICQICVALLSKRRLLNYLVEGYLKARCVWIASSKNLECRESVKMLNDARRCPFDENPDLVIARSRTPSPAFKVKGTKPDDEAISQRCEKVFDALLRILACVTSTLCSVTPPLMHILRHEGYDLDGVSPLLDLSFTSPSLEDQAVTCFGTIIASIHLCFKIIQKGNCSDISQASPSKKTELSTATTAKGLAVDEDLMHRLTIVIENSLVLILSQASLYLRHPSVDMQAKQLLKRELGSELRHFLHLYTRRLSRHPSILSPPASEKQSASVVYKRSPSKLGPLFSDDDENSIFKITDVFSKQLLQ